MKKIFVRLCIISLALLGGVATAHAANFSSMIGKKFVFRSASNPTMTLSLLNVRTRPGIAKPLVFNKKRPSVFIVRRGKLGGNTISFEFVGKRGHFLLHQHNFIRVGFIRPRNPGMARDSSWVAVKRRGGWAFKGTRKFTHVYLRRCHGHARIDDARGSLRYRPCSRRTFSRDVVFAWRAPKKPPVGRRGYCGCYNLFTMCRKLGGVVRRYPRYGTHCVIKNQSASYTHTLSYRMQDFPKDCAMFGKKLRSNLGKLIKARRLTCGAKPAARRGYCGCYNLPRLCSMLRGSVRTYPRYGTHCVIKNQSASYTHTLSYRMHSYPQDCVMFGKKLRSNLGKLLRSKRITCRSFTSARPPVRTTARPRTKWFRLKTMFRGNGECLEGNQARSRAHAGAAFMTRCRNVTGQVWRMVPSRKRGWFHLKTRFRGNNECLEGNQARSRAHAGAAFMDRCKNVSGQFWRMVPARKKGWFRLKTMFRGNGECLEGNQARSRAHAGAAFMDRCKNVSGQLWRMVPTR